MSDNIYNICVTALICSFMISFAIIIYGVLTG